MGEQEYKLGALCHMEIPAPDTAKAKEFYSSVFGWKVDEVSEMGGYMFFGADNFGGGFDPSAKVSPDGVNLVLAVSDIPAKLAEIVESGGEAVQEKTEIGGGHGFYATFKDPNGNRLSIWCRN